MSNNASNDLAPGEAYATDVGIDFAVESFKAFDNGTMVAVRGSLKSGVLRTGLKLWLQTPAEERLVSIMTITPEGTEDFAVSVRPDDGPVRLQLQVYFGPLDVPSVSLRTLTAAEELEQLKRRQTVPC